MDKSKSTRWIKKNEKEKQEIRLPFTTTKKHFHFQVRFHTFAGKRKERLIIKSLVSRKRSIFLSIIHSKSSGKTILVEDRRSIDTKGRSASFDEFFNSVWSRLAHDREKRKEKRVFHHVATSVCFWRTPNQQRLSPLRTNLRVYESLAGEFGSAMCTPLPVPTCLLTFEPVLSLSLSSSLI